ncbi:hypothetical protein IQ255_01030 [Pleurocapsales cyanobacterium LEGE 10410]|nr:hypothetical protein [Pleurocapsales cyanobacterium LEGE 10410]
MIYERFILITTCAVLSSSTTWAIESRTAKFLLAKAQTDTASNTSTEHHKINYLQNGEWIGHREVYQLAQDPQNNLKQQTILDSSTSSEPPQNISQRWSILGMIATVLTGLLLLWRLFKKPSLKQKPKIIAIAPQNDLDSSELVYPSNIQIVKKITSIEESNKLSNPDHISTHKLNLAENELNLTIEELAREIHLLELIEDLQQDDLYSRRKAVNRLAQVGNSRAIEPLVEIMSGANSVDKSLILKAITQIANRSLRSINHELFTALQNEDPEIRKSSIRDLTILYEFVSPMIEQLAHMQSDTDIDVQQTAKQAMKKLNLDSFSVATNYLKHSNQNSVFNIFDDRDATEHN